MIILWMHFISEVSYYRACDFFLFLFVFLEFSAIFGFFIGWYLSMYSFRHILASSGVAIVFSLLIRSPVSY